MPNLKQPLSPPPATGFFPVHQATATVPHPPLPVAPNTTENSGFKADQHISATPTLPTAKCPVIPSLSLEPPVTPQSTVLALTPASGEQINQAVQDAISTNFQKVPPRAGESRHGLNQRLQSCPTDGSASPSPIAKGAFYDGSDIVIIAFEGTGAFEPRLAPVMQDAAQRLAQQGLTLQNANHSLQYAASIGLAQKQGHPSNWSGLAAGPLENLLKNPPLDAKTQWLSFPSEEFEILANSRAIQNSSFGQILDEAIGSYEGETPGINMALNAVRDIQAQAKAQGKNPQFVVISHSSGGRSTVKFLEKAKAIPNEQGQPLKFPFVMTIDPVREAHEAVGEALKELLYKGTEHNLNRVRGWVDALPLIEWEQKKVYPPLVRHTAQPESLYAPGNTDKFINFYQQRDTEGLKMSPRFGIHGSPVKGAENHEVYDLGTAGHGEITYHPTVTQTFVEQLKGLLKP